MKISFVICTKNRDSLLSTCLSALNKVNQPDCEAEIVIVDNGSTDRTSQVISNFMQSSPWKVKTVFAAGVGLGHARNAGIKAGSGDVIIFSDDDCYLEQHYFHNFLSSFDPTLCQYGGGQILLFDRADDQRVANQKITSRFLIRPGTPVIPAGLFQGANMFFLRKVFEKAGLFNESMGAGTPFPCEDIEMACRASHLGFTGAQLPGFTVYHHHGRKAGSPEALATIRSYDLGRGAYYASLLARGVPGAWAFWQGTFSKNEKIESLEQVERLSRELLAASQYLEMLSSKIKARAKTKP